MDQSKKQFERADVLERPIFDKVSLGRKTGERQGAAEAAAAIKADGPRRFAQALMGRIIPAHHTGERFIRGMDRGEGGMRPPETVALRFQGS